MENRFVAIVGMCGAGKSIVADRLVLDGYGFFRFGQIVLDIVKERGLELTEDNERSVREEVRAEHGMGAMAILNLPKIRSLLAKGDVVGDGLYSWTEYKILKSEFGDRMSVVAVHARPALRHERISKRVMGSDDKDLRNRPFSVEAARKRDFAEIENIEKGGPIAMADFMIENHGTKEEFRAKIDDVIRGLKG
ncbi:dephospho-CoA kinase [Candidatus Woesearchaeota archaeon CG11_big_fil_rev_8_21_14_0_20_43_8]|nr:MAG: dephospho-CoA kinase [Candidatus Woesearchaeota archaeon CG11_big_fil_rev_8_21_14_0_20_43_8]PIO05379.1 MAG: dephospho-CoA kinase [Candidatus Woesearchaeota archaeon CG08_land_8_20_14_0_20_43_7]